jgi:hypothetical protein
MNRTYLNAAIYCLLLVSLIISNVVAEKESFVDNSRMWFGEQEDSAFGVARAPGGGVFVTGQMSSIPLYYDKPFYQYGKLDFFLAKMFIGGTGGILDWVITGGGSSDDCGLAAAPTPDDGVIVVGYTNMSKTSNATFAGTAHFNELDNASLEIFIAKYSSDASLEWIRFAGGQGDDKATGVAVDSDGYIYVTGTIEVSPSYEVKFDSGSGKTTVPGAYTGSKSIDMFIAKFKSDGTLVWAKSGGTINDDSSNGIAIGSDGVYIIGEIKASTTNKAKFGTTTVAGLQESDTSDIVVVKYDFDGGPLYVQVFGSANYDAGNAIAVKNHFVYITGTTTIGNNDKAKFGPSINLNGMNTGAKSKDIFLAKLSASDGSVVWAQIAGGDLDDIGTALTVTVEGSVVLTGTVTADSYFGSEQLWTNTYNSSDTLTNGFFAKFFPDGKVEWLENFGGKDTDLPRAITTSGYGCWYATGAWRGKQDDHTPANSVGFKVGTQGSGSSSPNWNYDLFLSKYCYDQPEKWCFGKSTVQSASFCSNNGYCKS